RACVDLQLLQLLTAERALREHAAHRETHNALGVAAEQLLEALAADTAGVTRVAGVRPLLPPACTPGGPRRPDRPHVITRVAMRRPDRLVLAAQQVGDLGGEATEDGAFGIDHVPFAGDVVGLGRERTHSKFFRVRQSGALRTRGSGPERTRHDSRTHSPWS